MIEIGAKVRDKSTGQLMDVTGEKEGEFRCDWFNGSDAIHKSEWFTEEELELVKGVDGGFRDAGE